MSTLHLIRHGKATPGKESYDELHPLGETQARLLGSYYLAQRQHFDAVYCGPLLRQRETARLMREAAGEVGASWPATIELAALEEAQLEQVFRRCVPERLVHDTHLQGLVAQITGDVDKAKSRSAFEAVLDYVVLLWSTGELGAPDIETAPAFSERVIGALEEIVRREGEGRQVAIVTSNGVIGRLLLHVTEERDAERHGPTQRLMNSSRSLVSVDSGKLAVVAKNLVDHLPNADLHTFI